MIGKICKGIEGGSYLCCLGKVSESRMSQNWVVLSEQNSHFLAKDMGKWNVYDLGACSKSDS